MIARYRFRIAVLALVLAIAACSDDDPVDTGKVDTTPPTVSSATAIDANHVEIAFGEAVDRSSAEDPNNYEIVEGDPLLSASSASSPAPGDPLPILAFVLGSDQRTVHLTTADMDSLRYDITISGVKDKSGNTIATPVVTEFVGSTDADVTPPYIAYRSPGSNAQGVLTTAVLTVTFSEPVTYESLLETSWSSAAGTVEFAIDTGDGAHVVFTPFSPLDPGTAYTIYMNPIDEAGNAAASTWGFTTTSTTDQTPPTIASSNPAHLATNVPLGASIRITFSEPMQSATPLIEFFPYLDWYFDWLDPRTLEILPVDPLAADQQYTVTIYPDDLYDLTGNAFAIASIVFTTGNEIARGGIAGTLRGDSQSDYASDPTGAFVLVAESGFEVAGTDVVPGNDSYSVQNLLDGEYVVLAALESNGDGVFDVGRGDAFGIYGADVRAGDFEEEIVTISGGNRVTGANFELFDASVISGLVAYNGTYAKEVHDVHIGLFDTNGYDPLSEPDYATYVTWTYYNDFYFESFDNGPNDGTFYIGAYLDANDNVAYDPVVDPAVFYDDPSDAITVDNGSDLNDLVLYLEDPLPGLQAAAVAWPVQPVQKTKRSDLVERVSAMVLKAGREAKR
jgi:Bacterial Ig-like domain